MNLSDIVRRGLSPKPWEEGEKIPWNDPAFSARMLREHLSQEHDAASRRFATIDAQVAWIHSHVLSGKPSRVLDLGCGPGLYASRLARLGHEEVGIDFSPASIAYAIQQAQAEGLGCTYRQEDIRRAEYGTGFGLVMLIFGEFNVFTPADTRLILKKARAALAEGGQLLLEPHTFAAVRQMAERAPSWYASESGLFSERPYLCLNESFWEAEQHITTKRYWIVDAATGEVTRHADSTQAYTEEEYRALLHECGFGGVTFYPSLKGIVDETQQAFIAIVAQKGTGGM